MRGQSSEPSRDAYEFVIIGCGIAGASLAHALAVRGARDVLVLEREATPAEHASGRSAAVHHEGALEPTWRRLKALSTPFLREPPPGFTETPLVRRAGVVWASGGQAWADTVAAAPAIRAEGIEFELLSAKETAARYPVLVATEFSGAASTPGSGRLDVHALLSGYLGVARRAGVEVACGQEVTGLLVESGRCVGVALAGGAVRARWVVNAAGAWAGALGALAGATPCGLTPRRRTAAITPVPRALQEAALDPRGWPMLGSDLHDVYFLPESGGILMSPMDETPVEPHDAQADDGALASGVERLRALAPRMVPDTVRRKWAGLRTFAPDRLPVVGEDPLRPGFFWCAGQGGNGIETSPALAAVAADLLMGRAPESIDPSPLPMSPARFLRRA